MNDQKTYSHQMINYARQFFKLSLKTGNKSFSLEYGLASPERKQRRLANEYKAYNVICDLRKYTTFDACRLLDSYPPQERAGDCHEYSCIALQYGKALEIPNVWLVDHKCHTFLVVANEIELKKKLALKEFDQYKNENIWVCDPWFNIHCELDMYGPMAIIQSSRWSIAGKEICSDWDLQEPANQWCQRLFDGEMKFLRMTDNSGLATHDCNNFLIDIRYD
ncbi:hypothetical protein [Endozoicomonas lisbonensis]|uniref:Transglutaminase-like domain-containing protein n=1 Tax=Endozoicomonas lisbonensis TaxID=3120522 RepID=A0ABV2SKI5_9GAMM